MPRWDYGRKPYFKICEVTTNIIGFIGDLKKKMNVLCIRLNVGNVYQIVPY